MAKLSQKFRRIISDISNADRRLVDVRTGLEAPGAQASAAARRDADRSAALAHTPRVG